MTTILDGADEVAAAVGTDLGHSPWTVISGEQIAAFEESAGPELGYLALALSNLLLPQIVEMRGFSTGVNYGTDSVRFGPTLQPGDLVRGSARLVEAVDIKGALQTRISITIEVDGSPHPACVIDSLSRWLP